VNNDAVSNAEFYARLRIEPMSALPTLEQRAAERAEYVAALLRRVEVTTAIKTTAAPMR
jgi:hypothetical protein